MLKTDIAFKTDLNKGFLPFITAFMVFLASITFATALISSNITSEWSSYMANKITIQVLPDMTSQKPQKELDDRIKNITTILKQTPGIKSHYIVSIKETSELLKPWLGDFTTDLPLPRIINVEVSDIIPLNQTALKKEIANYSKNIKFETFDKWIYDFKASISAIQTLLGIIIILILTTTGLTICYATKSGLNINKKVINIMHMVGATNKYITTQFSRQMMKLALLGGSIGYLFSCFTIFVIKISASYLTNETIGQFQFPTYIYLYVLIIPIIAGIIAKISAVLTINKELKKMV